MNRLRIRQLQALINAVWVSFFFRNPQTKASILIEYVCMNRIMSADTRQNRLTAFLGLPQVPPTFGETCREEAFSHVFPCLGIWRTRLHDFSMPWPNDAGRADICDVL